MLTAISAILRDDSRCSADEVPRFWIQVAPRDGQRMILIASENQGVASSNLALGTNYPHHRPF